MTRRLQYFETGCEFKFAEDGPKSGVFSGYGAVFGNTDTYGDVLERGAFKQTLREWEERGKFPPMLLQHGGGGLFGGSADDLIPVGKWTAMEENSKGLKVEGELFARDTDRGRYLFESMKAGALDGLSIGFRTVKFRQGTKAGEPRRYLEAVELRELSIVTFPANDRARISSVKSEEIDLLDTLSDCIAFLREAGGDVFSKRAANDFVGRIARIARREAGDDRNVEGLLEQLRSTRKLIVPTS